MCRYFYIFNSLFLILSGCAENTDQTDNFVQKKEENQAIYKQTEAKSENQNTDIYTIENKSVIFFIISKKEAQNLISEIGESYRWETEALLNGFAEQAKNFQFVLKRHNIKCAITTNEKFEIRLENDKKINFDRTKNDQLLGQILTNGKKEPLISFGMYRNEELAELIKSFFEISDLGSIPSDTLQSNKDIKNDTISVKQ